MNFYMINKYPLFISPIKPLSLIYKTVCYITECQHIYLNSTDPSTEIWVSGEIVGKDQVGRDRESNPRVLHKQARQQICIAEV